MQLLEALVPFLFVVGMVIAVWVLVGPPNTHEGWWFFTAMTGAIITIFWGTVAIATFAATTSEVGSLEAFHDQTLRAYGYTVSETNQIVLTDHALTDFSDKAASERIAELRDEIKWYNARLAQYERFEAMPIIGAIVADVPERLQPIVLESE